MLAGVQARGIKKIDLAVPSVCQSSCHCSCRTGTGGYKVRATSAPLATVPRDGRYCLFIDAGLVFPLVGNMELAFGRKYSRISTLVGGLIYVF